MNVINSYKKRNDGTFINSNSEELKRYQQARAQAVKAKQLEDRISTLELQVQELISKVK